MRLWTESETRVLLKLAAALVVLAAVAHLALPPALATSLVVIASALGVAALALSLRRWLVEWLIFERGQQQAMDAIHAVLPLRAPLPALTGWAATPRFVAEVLQCVGLARQAVPQDRPLRILECGSGVSTLAVGYALQQAAGGGRIISLDHDAEYGAITEEQTRLHGLTEQVQIVHAPLVDHQVDGERYPWYDLSRLQDYGPFDMLIVDGPPESVRPQARYPAFPLLEDLLADQAFVLLDDTARPHERAAYERWVARARGELKVRYFEEGRGYAIGRYRRED